MEYTKDNPGCYHSMIKYLSELTGITMGKTIKIDGVKKGKKLLYKSYHINVVDSRGERFSYIEEGKRYDERGIMADHFEIWVYRDEEEFGIPISKVGKYKDWEGDGYFLIDLMKVNDKYFAYIGCSCV